VVSSVGVGLATSHWPARVNVTGPISTRWSRKREGRKPTAFALSEKRLLFTGRVTLAHSIYLLKVIPNKGDR
jgi:hypothetical protein